MKAESYSQSLDTVDDPERLKCRNDQYRDSSLDVADQSGSDICMQHVIMISERHEILG